MGRRGRRQTQRKPASKPKTKPPDSDIEEGEIPESTSTETKAPNSDIEEGEIPETDYEQSSSTPANTTPERNTEQIPSITEEEPSTPTKDLLPASTEDPQSQNAPNIDANCVNQAVFKKPGSSTHTGEITDKQPVHKETGSTQLVEDGKLMEETDNGHSGASATNTTTDNNNKDRHQWKTYSQHRKVPITHRQLLKKRAVTNQVQMQALMYATTHQQLKYQ